MLRELSNCCNLTALVTILILSGCSCQQISPRKLYALPAFSAQNTVHAVIEIPAGTNKKFEYNPDRGNFFVDQRDGKDRIIHFLPYPGNYGFIPSTRMDPEAGGDGDALDILVLSESVPTGTLLEVIPIAALMLIDEGEEDTKIIAVPAEPKNRTIQATTFADFTVNYPMARKMIEDWMLNYDGMGHAISRGWKDENIARQIIQTNLVTKQ